MSGSRSCSVCFQGFTEDSRVPKNLPCGHTFCSKCVESLVSRASLVCPDCRQRFDEPGVTTNFALRDLLAELLASEPPVSAVEVPEDMHDQSPAQYRAKEWICHGCTLRNYESVEFCSACEMARPQEVLQAGDKIILQGLNTHHYNGQAGTLKFFCYGVKRWEVKLDVVIEGKQMIRVKPANLVLGSGSSSAGSEQQSPVQSSGQTIFIVNGRIQVVRACANVMVGDKGRVVQVDSATGRVWVDFDLRLVFVWVSMDILKKEGEADAPIERSAGADASDGGGGSGEESGQSAQAESPPEHGNPSRWRNELIFGADHGLNIQRCPECLRATDSENCNCNSPERADPDEQRASSSQQPGRLHGDRIQLRGRSHRRDHERRGRYESHSGRRCSGSRSRSHRSSRRRYDNLRDSRSRGRRRRSPAPSWHRGLRGGTHGDSRSRSRRNGTHRGDARRGTRDRRR